jgi:hypothetical protein
MKVKSEHLNYNTVTTKGKKGSVLKKKFPQAAFLCAKGFYILQNNFNVTLKKNKVCYSILAPGNVIQYPIVTLVARSRIFCVSCCG